MGWSLQVEKPPAFEGETPIWGEKGIFGDFILPPNWNIVEIMQKDSPWLRATARVGLSFPPIVRLWGLVTLDITQWGRQRMWQDVQAGAHWVPGAQLGVPVGPQAGAGGR